MDPCICALAFLNKNQMRGMAEENNFSIPSSLRVDEYRKRLGNALSGDPQDYVPQDNFIQSLTKVVISASFLKPLQSNTEDSKHTTLGHRLETPAHKAFWCHIHMDKTSGCVRTGVDYQSL